MMADGHGIWYDYAFSLSLNHVDRYNFKFKKSKTADGRHIEKSKNRHIWAMVQPIDTKFGMVTHVGNAC